TSAGRVPTDLGYRVYVDYLLKPESLSEEEKKVIKQEILREGHGVQEILGQTARVLSEITNQLGLTMAPSFEKGILHSLRLIPVAEGRVMVVVVVQSGLARSVIVEVEVAFRRGELQDVEGLLNERLAGLTLQEIRRTISERVADVSGKGRLLQLVLDSGDKIWTEDHSEDLKIAGTDVLLAKPEFTDRKKVSQLMQLLEERRILSELLSQTEEEGLIITIGKESKIDQIVDCSLVKSAYRVGNVTGTIGIIGPTRMPYAKAVSIVEYAARSITEVLTGISNHKDS
ncbi:MAG: heat-inducible transcription repressor HrcA, partial [Candidatus Zixiibacteriota bacterium]